MVSTTQPVTTVVYWTGSEGFSKVSKVMPDDVTMMTSGLSHNKFVTENQLEVLSLKDTRVYQAGRV